MNIDKAILEYAESQGLTAITTGGGMDYVHRVLHNKKEIILAGLEDLQPTSLDDRATVIIYDDDQWMDGVTFSVDSARQGIDIISRLLSTI